ATVALLLGFVGLAVSGMLVKILSFLTWTRAFGSAAGRPGPAPLLRDLTRARLEPVITVGLGFGALAATAAVAAPSGTLAALAASALLVGAVAQLWQTGTVVARTLGGRLTRPREVVTTKCPLKWSSSTSTRRTP